MDDRGRAWAALTLSSAVAVVDPVSGTARRIRLARSRELLATAWDGENCLVVDADRRVIWHIDEASADGRERRVAALALPDGMVRPDFVVATPGGDLWVTDTARPVLGHLPAGAQARLVDLPAPSHVALVDADAGCLWVSHWDDPLVSRLELADPDAPLVTHEISGLPFGFALGPDGRAWAAVPARDEIVAVAASGTTETHSLPAGSGPGAVSLAWSSHHLYVACSKTASTARWRKSPA